MARHNKRVAQLQRVAALVKRRRCDEEEKRRKMAASKVWLITGCSAGFGCEIASAALQRGDRVIATARNPANLDHLKELGAATIALNVLSSDADMHSTISDAIAIYGQIDILVNNEVLILQGAVEECSGSEVLDQFNTNVFGQLKILRAILPHMRSRRSGVIANMGSLSGWRGYPLGGMYSATKFAMAGITEALRTEVASFNIAVTIIEAGYFQTDFLAEAHRMIAKRKIEDMVEPLKNVREGLDAHNGKQQGDPVKGAKIIVEALTQSGRCEGKELPPRLALGNDAVKVVAEVLDTNRQYLDEWKDFVSSANHDVLENIENTSTPRV